MDGTRSRGSLRSLVLVLAAVAILIGIGARVANLNAPLFWQDEAYTALRTTGHLQEDYLKLFDGRMHRVADVRAFETLDPARGVPAVVTALAHEDPHHSPLFYALDRMWIGAFGTSPAGFRGLSAALGIVAIGLAFALGTTLFRSRIGGAVAASLFAISPIFVVYARQAREYALFSCAIMLATLALVRALRTGGFVAWFAYALGVALGFYVDPIFALVVAGHAVTVVLQPGAMSARVRGFATWAAATVAGGLAFVPWALNAFASRGNISDQLDWGANGYPLKALAQKWTFNVGALFFDGEFRTLLLAPIAIAIVLVVLALVANFVRRGDRAIARVLVPFGVATFVVLVGRDALFHSHFSVIARYLTPMWIAALFVCAAMLFAAMQTPRTRVPATSLWAVLLCAGIASIGLRGFAENWWDNNDQIAYQAVAREIDDVPSPVMVSERHPHVPLVMARYLRATDDIVLFQGPVPALPGDRDAFVVAPSPETLAALSARSRGRYDVVNVSPKMRTIIASFHKDVLGATKTVHQDYTVAFVPENALWLLRPVHRTAGGSVDRAMRVLARKTR